MADGAETVQYQGELWITEAQTIVHWDQQKHARYRRCNDNPRLFRCVECEEMHRVPWEDWGGF